MPKKNARQAQRTRYRTSAAAARARQRARRKSVATSVVAALIVLAFLGLFLGFGGSSKNASTTTTTPSSTTAPTTTVPALPSAAGKPCVSVKGALPAGAPAVPVETGAPPKALITKDLKAGTGAVVKAGQTLSVDYIGVSCSTGKIFDSSYSRNQPATIPLTPTGVITGWQKGIPGMKVGGERLLGIPPADGYGPAGRAPEIAPEETLWFVVHVRSAK